MWHLLMGLAIGDEIGLDSTETLVQELQEQPFQIGVQSDVFLALGGTSGISLSSVNGGFVGLEASLSRVNGNRLLGLSGDALWDTGLGGVSATVGPRVGVLMLAMDGGIGVRSDFTNPVEIGAQLRWLVNLGFGTVYYRAGFWPNADELSSVHQIGFGLKFPQIVGG
jgi:hypothetical protein